MRRLVIILAFAVVGCAASTNAADGGADMAAGVCDSGTLFSSCTEQCGFRVCGIGSATCEGGAWMCDCSQAVLCGNADGGKRD
jgi:hypothetical protein